MLLIDKKSYCLLGKYIPQEDNLIIYVDGNITLRTIF